MADYIAIMNRGAIEQLGTPQAIYDRPATTFVADSSLPGNEPHSVPASLPRAAPSVEISGARIAIPETREPALNGNFILGARPEHIQFDDGSEFRGEVFGHEYLGTTPDRHRQYCAGPASGAGSASVRVTAGSG